jgi:flagellar basal-body rod modification protein FlgD
MSSVTPVTNSTTTDAATGATTSAGNSTLGYKDFLNLLTVQMQNQDPFNPMSDTDFIAQMANFSTLDQVSTLSTNFSSYSARQQQISSQAYLGKYVTVEPPSGSAASGQVTAVSIGSDGTIYATINGQNYDASSITSVANGKSGNSATNPVATATATGIQTISDAAANAAASAAAKATNSAINSIQ